MFQESQDLKAHRDRKEKMERMERKEQKEILVIEDLMDQLEIKDQ